MSQDYDVIVLGGGIVGASTAYSLVKQGQNVLLIDQFEPGHKQGSSHGDGRIIRFNYTEAIYVEMAMQVYPLWADLGKESGEGFIIESGLIEYGDASREEIGITEGILTKYDIPYERLSPAEANERFPQFTFEENSQVLFQPGGGVVRATPAVKALWRLVEEKGGTTLTGKRIESVSAEENRVTVSIENGETITAKNLVLTAGGWTKKLAVQLNLDLPLTVTQEVLAYFPTKNTAINHQAGTMPGMIDYSIYDEIEPHFYSLPMMEIQGVKMGRHHAGAEIDADNERYIDHDVVETMKRQITRRYPHLNPEPMDMQSCLYSDTPDYHFILDQHPQYDNVTIGAGFSGHGFKFGPLLGEILAGLVLGQEAPVALDTFSIKRFDNQKLDKRAGA